MTGRSALSMTSSGNDANATNRRGRRPLSFDPGSDARRESSFRKAAGASWLLPAGEVIPTFGLFVFGAQPMDWSEFLERFR